MDKENVMVPELRFPGYDGEWEQRALADLIIALDSGKSVNSEDEAISSDQEWGVLKTSCVSGGEFFERENKRIIEEEVQLAKCPPEAGTIIISRMNTPMLVGESGYVSKDYPNLFLPDRLWMARVNQTDAIPKWLAFFLITNKVRFTLKSIATGTSGSMKNISKPNFLS
ncbi:MAG: restriction endonuclease subunit S, partial [Bacteroidota bacterium]